MLWQHVSDELEIFHQYLNTRIPTKPFTKKFSSEEVSFLDLKVCNINNVSETDLYSEPTNSAHPKHAKVASHIASWYGLRHCAQG